MNKTACPHGPKLTRLEAGQHMACTDYGREVNPRTVDRWADAGLIIREKIGGLQWVRFDRDQLAHRAAAIVKTEVGQQHQPRPITDEHRANLRKSARARRCPKCGRDGALVTSRTGGTDPVCRWKDCRHVAVAA